MRQFYTLMVKAVAKNDNLGNFEWSPARNEVGRRSTEVPSGVHWNVAEVEQGAKSI